jgi:Protein of unknown function (DUF1566)
MKKIFIGGAFIFFVGIVQAQNVGIGTATPAAKLNIIGAGSSPAIPGATSTGIFRIGISPNEGIDFGKLPSSPFSAWMQAGYNASSTDPISLQPLGGNVGIGIISPASSAKLDVSSTTQGFLPPRMTGTQRNAISTPSAGLIIWCKDCGADGGELQAFNGISWRNMVGEAASDLYTFAIGQPYLGGKIAYILQPGDAGYIAGETHGLIAGASDQSTGVQWGCQGTLIPGADGTALGTGNQNTIDIMAGCATAGIAARLCDDLLLNGYSDWYLPSKDELNKLYINQAAVGGFAGSYYWSSTEFDNNSAWGQLFILNFGNQVNGGKAGTSNRVRAVRAF